MKNIKDWKLKLRYKKETTPFQHFTVIAEGFADNPIEEYDCPKGNAFMAIKVWATDTEESQNVALSIASHIGFNVNGTIEVYKTEPQEPPRENPFGYDVMFSSFK